MNAKKSQNKMIIAVIIAAIIIISGLYYLAVTLPTEPEKKEEEKEKEIIDKISPLTTQAVFLEIHRVRKKGIIDVMMKSGSDFFVNLLTPKDIKIDSPKDYTKLSVIKALEGLRPGKGWDQKPSYKYFAVLDGFEFESRQTYKKWDTGYINQQIFRNVEEEQETTEVELKIIENKVVKKFIGSSTTKKEMDSFKVIYDFRTGRWEGDDYFNDSDGYGHYNGSNYEIWFTLHQTSADMDDIPWWVEVNVLGTDPTVDDSRLDPDGDGIPTEWEWKWGYDPNTFDNHSDLDPDQDGLQNDEEYFLSEWLANPYHKEIYIETDYMEKTPKKLFNRDGFDGWEHEFYEESQQMIIERFNEHGITVHIDDGCMGEGGDLLPFDKGTGVFTQEKGVVAGFYANNFADERKGSFRYVMVLYGGGWCHPQDSNHFYDCIAVPHNRKFYINAIGYALTDRAKRIGQAVQVLHELGHSLGMNRGNNPGIDNTSLREENSGSDYPWFDYISVMNYDYFYLRYFDYSDGSHGENDVNDWDRIDLTFFQEPAKRMEGLSD